MNLLQLRRYFLACCLTCLSISASTYAATVTYTLQINPYAGTFDVFAQASLGDNDGLATFAMEFEGDFTSINHVSPAVVLAESGGIFGDAGFAWSPAPNPDGSIYGSQNTLDPSTHRIYGFGQYADSFANLGLNTISPARQPAWDVPLWIVSGTYDPTGEEVFINQGPLKIISNVFGGNSPSGLISADPVVLVTYIPEPASGLLAGLALVGLLSLVRRRSCQACASQLG